MACSGHAAVSLAITGIGTLHEEARLSSSAPGTFRPPTLTRLRAEGIVGETVGRFFDVQGARRALLDQRSRHRH